LPEQEFDRELRSHLDLEAQEQAEGGLEQDQARQAAQRIFGNSTAVKEEIREMRAGNWMLILRRQ